MPDLPELGNRLKLYVSSGAGSTPSADDPFIEACIAEAVALVENECGTSIDLVPVEVLHGAYIEVGAELYFRRQAPQGISQFAAADGSAIRTRRDPLDGVRPMLRNFLPAGFA